MLTFADSDHIFPSASAQCLFLLDACQDNAAEAFELARWNYRFANENDARQWIQVMKVLEVSDANN